MRKLPQAPSSWHNSCFHFHAPVTDMGELIVAGTNVLRETKGSDKLRILGSWAFVYIVEGTGLYKDSSGNPKDIGPGSWLLLFPGVPHSYGPHSSWKEFYLLFHGPLFEVLRSSHVVSPSYCVGELTPVQKNWKYLKTLTESLARSGVAPCISLCDWMQYLVSTCHCESSDPNPIDGRLKKAMQLIAERFSRHDFNWDSVSQDAGLSYSNLRKLFRVEMNTSPGKYRESVRVEKAIQLLQVEHLTAAKIAEMLGYYDAAHFSKAFLRETGLTFTQAARGPRTILTKPKPF